jgi:hypothetical protein
MTPSHLAPLHLASAHQLSHRQVLARTLATTRSEVADRLLSRVCAKLEVCASSSIRNSIEITIVDKFFAIRGLLGLDPVANLEVRFRGVVDARTNRLEANPDWVSAVDQGKLYKSGKIPPLRNLAFKTQTHTNTHTHTHTHTHTQKATAFS